MLQQKVKSVAQGLEAARTGPTDAEVSKFPSARSPNNYAMTADEGTTFYNRPDARVSRSRRA
jgi:hypothetical protein